MVVATATTPVASYEVDKVDRAIVQAIGEQVEGHDKKPGTDSDREPDMLRGGYIRGSARVIVGMARTLVPGDHLLPAKGDN